VRRKKVEKNGELIGTGTINGRGACSNGEKKKRKREEKKAPGRQKEAH